LNTSKGLVLKWESRELDGKKWIAPCQHMQKMPANYADPVTGLPQGERVSAWKLAPPWDASAK